MRPIMVRASDDAPRDMDTTPKTTNTKQISHWKEVRHAYCTKEVRPSAENDLAMQVPI